MQYLLDTHICIYLIKKRPPEVLELFRLHSLHDVAICTITLFELEFGAQKSQQMKRSQKALAEFLLPLTFLDIHRSAATEAAIIRGNLAQKGTPVGPYDLLIAGLARSRKMTLVTDNMQEFARIDGLLLQNWVAP